MARKKVRQAEIARAADVSVATVDRVLNARPGVNVHTARRILDAKARLERGDDLSQTSPVAPLSFDFILPAGPNTFMKMMEAAALTVGDRMTKRRVMTRCHRIDGFDPQALADAIRRVGRKSDGLAIVALENPIVREAVNEIRAAGIPIVAIISNLSSAQTIGYVGLDNRAAGRTAGFLMGRFLAGGRGEVAILEGSLSLSYRDHQERELGFRDAVAEQFPQIEIVGRWATQDHFRQSHQQCLDVVRAHPDLAGIYFVGSGVRGIADALREAGAERRVVFIGHDLTPFTRQYLIDGTVDAILHQSPEVQAMAAVELLTAHHRGADAVRAPECPRIEVFLRENLP